MRTLLLFVAAALLAMVVSGCTVIGFGIGAAVDHHHARPRHATWQDTETIPRGSAVHVTLTSDSIVQGEFTGLRTLPEKSYVSIYDSVRAILSERCALPKLGDTVTVVPKGWHSYWALFYGFGALTVDLRQPEQKTPSYMSFHAVTELQDIQGRPYDMTCLRTLMAARALPTGQRFEVLSDQQSTSVPLEHIRDIFALPRRSHYWVLGGVMGLAVDAAVVALIVHGLEEHPLLSMGAY
jgi:hypothetical protein